MHFFIIIAFLRALVGQVVLLLPASTRPAPSCQLDKHSFEPTLEVRQWAQDFGWQKQQSATKKQHLNRSEKAWDAVESRDAKQNILQT